MLNLLRSGDPHAQENATTALWNAMVDNEKSRIELIKNKGMPLLIQQLVAGTPVGQELAAGAIWKSCANDPSLKEEAKAAIPGLVSLLRTGTDAAKEHAAGALRSACINSAPNKAELNRVNGIAALMEVIQTAGPRAREQAGAALANACANSIQNQVSFLHVRAFEVFFESWRLQRCLLGLIHAKNASAYCEPYAFDVIRPATMHGRKRGNSLKYLIKRGTISLSVCLLGDELRMHNSNILPFPDCLIRTPCDVQTAARHANAIRVLVNVICDSASSNEMLECAIAALRNLCVNSEENQEELNRCVPVIHCG